VLWKGSTAEDLEKGGWAALRGNSSTIKSERLSPGALSALEARSTESPHARAHWIASRAERDEECQSHVIKQ
jgi:hypothetical protein